MSTKHVRSAADLARFKCGLKVECGNCGNSRTMDGIEVAKAYGTTPFRQLASYEVLTLRSEGDLVAGGRVRNRVAAGD